MPEQAAAIGGQAVIEGVMMRGPKGYAVSVRRSDGRILTQSCETLPLVKRHRLLNLPILRGAVSLIEMMVIGYRCLDFSANEAAKDIPDPKTGEAPPDTGEKAFSKWVMAVTLCVSLALGMTLFVVIPNLSTHFLGWLAGREENKLIEENAPVAYNLVSGAIRLVIVVGYIWAISFMKDIRRLFQYHGAEHKTVKAYEANLDLTLDNVRPFSTFHPRCGTTFIALVLMVSVVVFAFFAHALVMAWPTFPSLHLAVRKAVLIFGHILIMPIVAGLCYEMLKFGGRHSDNALVRAVIAPGFWFQRLTTKEPDDSMLEVAITSLKEAVAIGEERAADRAQEGETDGCAVAAGAMAS